MLMNEVLLVTVQKKTQKVISLKVKRQVGSLKVEKDKLIRPLFAVLMHLVDANVVDFNCPSDHSEQVTTPGVYENTIKYVN